MKYKITNWGILAGIPFLFGACTAEKKEASRPNVLFICVDDLRHELGSYGSIVKTPHMDKLASEGSLFFNHYTQIPTSGASRASMLTGMLPRDKSDLTNEACHIRLSDKLEGEHPETMFHHLKRNGYYTVGIGKISHAADGKLYAYNDPVGTKRELPYSWDEMIFDAGQWKTGWNAFFGYSNGTNRQSEKRQVKPYECADIPDEGLPDGLTANLAVGKLKELAGKGEPFCLAVGFFKPHLPFTAPKKYWDMYDEEAIPLSPTPDIPEGCHLSTLLNSGEFNGYELGEEKASLKEKLSAPYARKVRHAYFACVSYVDAQIGKVLEALEESGLADNTVVILWGDHGWQLGDYRVWGKHTLHDVSLSSTLIVKAPGTKQGIKNRRVVSSVDIYPTLMELCGVDCPEGLDGCSFVKLLTSPEDADWEDIAYSYFGNGISVRTPRFRLSRYINKKDTIMELYEYDKDIFERKNILAERPDIVEELLPILIHQKGKYHR
ncbi:sulfatase [Parabacteroides massiliensis]|uniref:sulfatase n=1 Tax=Parabacteroides massiliensis TaxID=1750560 RepID=UPI00096A7CD1|nr:sulfatase [Parabacteroides massiliensis]